MVYDILIAESNFCGIGFHVCRFSNFAFMEGQDRGEDQDWAVFLDGFGCNV